jgi:integrase
MPDLGKKISWKVDLSKGDTSLPPASADVFLSFVNFCEDKVPTKRLMKDCALFEEQRAHIKSEYAKFIEEVSEKPFLASFLVWVKEVAYREGEAIEGAKMLLEHGLIGVTDDEGHPWTIGKAKGFDHRTVIDTIRCHKEWTLPVRENLVKTYISFISWLSFETHFYIPRLEDPDLDRSRGRLLPYSAFLSFLDALPNEKARLVANLLYFGGSRTMEEVLQLTLKNVDFDKKVIYYEFVPVSYPAHVFSDIKSVMKPRTSGKVFLGRQETALHPATIFRNFKEAAVKAGLGPLFTPAYLTTDK